MITTVFYLDKKIVVIPSKIQHIGGNAVGKADNIFTSGREVLVVNGILAEAFAEDIGIRTAAAVQVIITSPTDQGVVAIPSIQIVITRPAVQGIVTVAAV